MSKNIWIVILLLAPTSLFAQPTDSLSSEIITEDTLEYERFIETVENSIFEYCLKSVQSLLVNK